MNANAQQKFAKRLYDYADYRLFLNDYVAMRNQKRAYSLSQFARDLGLQDHSSIAKVLHGRRAPGAQIVTKICDYFRFKERECSYFYDLVEYDKAKNIPARWAHIGERLTKANPKRVTSLVSLDEFAVISKWHHLAIREMFKLADCDGTIDWFHRRLRKKITKADIKVSLEKLLSIGLLKLKKQRLVISKASFTTPSHIKNEAIRRYHESSIPLGIEALRDTPTERRTVVGSTICIKEESLEKANEIITRFQDEMAQVLETGDGNQVYQLNVQFFPLTAEKAEDPPPSL